MLNPEIVRAAGPIDPDLPFLLFLKDKTPVGSLTVFALHADTVGGTEYSADYPGQLAAELRRTFGDRFTSVFATGTCGDINHIDVSGRRRYDARYLGRKNDPEPGHELMWQGYSQLVFMCEGFALRDSQGAEDAE